MTQADERDTQVTAVVTAYACWRKQAKGKRNYCCSAEYYQGVIYFEQYYIVILYSYSNPAEHYLVLFALNIIVLVHLWAAGEKTQPSNGHMREKRP